MDDDRIHGLIGTIYDAALDPGRWVDVIGKLKAITKSRHGHLWCGSIHDDMQTLLSEPNHYFAFDNDDYSFAAFKDVSDQLHGSPIREPHLEHVPRIPEGRASLGRETVPLAVMKASDYYNEFGRHFALFQMLGAVMIRNKEDVSAIGLYRSEQDALYTEKEKKLLDLFLPHIRRSLNLFGRLQLAHTKTQTLQSSIDGLSSALVLLDQTRKVVFLNAAARRFLKRCGDLSVRHDRLQAKAHADTVQLEHLTRRVTGASGARPIGGAVSIRRANGKLPLQVVGAPLSSDNQAVVRDGPGAAALLVIHDPDGRIPIPQEVVAALFGLTSMEGSLLLALGQGQTLRQYSEEHCVTYNTARTHLRSLFAKTNTSKQSDLVRLMSGLAHSLVLSE